MRYDDIMCRLAAYLGPELALGHFLIAPPHSLIEQSWRPREMTVGHLNADGYGIAWKAPDGTPARFTYSMPIWTDGNLDALGRSLRSDLWLGVVRSATPGFPAHPANTQPFVHGPLFFLHNGHLDHFAEKVRGRIRGLLDEDIEAGIEGTTDSEHLFALLRQILRDDRNSPQEALAKLAEMVQSCTAGTALLNVILTDGNQLYGLRYAVNAAAPSLYSTDNDDAFPGGVLICSEPLTASRGWRAVPVRSLLVLSPNRDSEVIPL